MTGRVNVYSSNSNAQNVATVMHDIASPVTLIRLNLDLLENEMDLNSNPRAQSRIIRKYIKRALTGVEKVTKIINYSIDTQYKNFVPENFDARNELQNIAKSFEVRTINENVELQLCLGTNSNKNNYNMAGSKDAFHRLFGNLISNSLDAYLARKSGKKNEKKICISAYINGDFIVITFEDKAGGIPKMIQKYLFKEQYTTKSKGNGLGLISIKAIVEEHFYGFLNCFCTKGIGTIFVIALPLSK